MSKEIVYSTDGETFNHDSTCDFELGDSYYSGEKVEINPGDLVSKWTVDNIVESMEENLFEIVGEVSEDNLHLSADDNNELQQIIVNFMKSKVKVTCYGVDNIKEHVITIDDIN